MNSETTTQAPAATQETPPSPGMTTSGLGELLKKSRQARASAASGSAAPPAADANPAANGSDTVSTNASRQPANVAGQVRTDDTNQPNAQATPGTPEAESAEDDAGSAGEAAAESGEDGTQDEAEPREVKPKGERTERRISKLVAQLKAKDAEIARLNAGGQAQPNGRQATTAETSSGPLGPIDGQIAQTKAALAWLRKNPDGGEIEINGRKVEISSEQAQQLAEDAGTTLTGLIARREVMAVEERELFEERRKEAAADMEAHYPWMNDREAPEFQEAVEMLQEMPRHVVEAMKALPDNRLILADMIAGRRARLAKAAASVGIRRPAVARPTPQPGAVTAAAPRVSGQRQEVANARNRLVSSGRTSDLAQMLAAKRRAARVAVA